MGRKSKDAIKLKGFLRVQLVNKKTGKIEGDSGWMQNVITNYGFESCIAALPMDGIGNTTQAAYLILGSGTEPATDATQLPGSNTDQVLTFAGVSVVASMTQRASAQFEGSDSSMAQLANIGLLAASSGPLIAGNTFASSAFSTDQQCNASYELQFSRV